MNRRCPSCGTIYTSDIFFCGSDGTITIEEQQPNDHDSRLGQTLGQYIVVARIADGAMGRVYEGRHVETKERVAVKVLHSDVARENVSVERFKREADTARELAHPNVVKIIDFGQTEDSSYFLTMEYLYGEELGQLLRREGKVARERTVRILSQLANGLDHAHSFGVVHRDLKPDNIFLCHGEDGDTVKILDFGSVKLQMDLGGAKLTAFGTTLGSPFYMSPEQAMGRQDVDHRTDVFAVGAILYEMCSGKVAFEATNVAAILMRILNDQPAPLAGMGLGVPPAVDDVVEKAIRKKKETRYASTGELANAFVAAIGLGPDSAVWRNKPIAEIAAALGTAQPAAPKPLDAKSLPPPVKPGGSPAVQSPTYVTPPVITNAQPRAAALSYDEQDALDRPRPPTTGLDPKLLMLGGAVAGGVAIIVWLLTR